jgi:hypothetical protein
MLTHTAIEAIDRFIAQPPFLNDFQIVPTLAPPWFYDSCCSIRANSGEKGPEANLLLADFHWER